MKKQSKNLSRLIISIACLLMLILLSSPNPASAQWPPFRFSLQPSYENGQITYHITFSKRVDWNMTHLRINIPIPEGTRFLRANNLPVSEVNFNGAEVSFFTPDLQLRRIGSLRGTNFVVEVTDPERTVFTTQAGISWQGDHPGDYLTKEFKLDLSKEELDWGRPNSRLQLEAGATVVDNVVTYTVYPRKVTRSPIWDAKINFSIPQGATYLSASASPPFEVAGFDGQQVSFTALELTQQGESAPLTIQVSTDGATTSSLVTHAWATWKNVGRRVGRSIPPEETSRSGDIIVQAGVSQRVVADMIGDVPFSDYDVTSLALQEDGNALQITFHTSGDVGAVGKPLQYLLYIDSDCNINTGKQQGNRGAEYRVRYEHDEGKANIYSWNTEGSRWDNREPIEASSPAGTKMVTMQVPFDLLNNSRQFCWIGQARNRTKEFSSNPRSEWVGREALNLSYYR
jgi:hypothetical protein